MLLNLIKLGRHDHRQRVLLAIHRALLQGSEHFGECHRCGHDAQALVGSDVYRVFHGAHLQALQVFRCLHIALAVGHVAETVFGPGQRLETFSVELGQQVCTKWSVQHHAGVRLVAEQKWHVDDFGLGHKVGYRACGGERQFLSAELYRFDGFALAAQRAVIKRLHFVAATRALFDLLRKHVNAHTLVRVLGGGDADLHGGLCGGGGHQTNSHNHAKRDAECKAGEIEFRCVHCGFLG